MSTTRTILILSDIHYAGAAEKKRVDFEFAAVSNPLLRLINRAFRHFIWQRDPFAHNHLLDQFIHEAGKPDHVIANGDYSCDSAFVGLSDDAAFTSARECLKKLHSHFPDRFTANCGDHELGKSSLVGNAGGMRLASWERTLDLKIKPCWQVDIGRYALIGVVSSLVALPIFERDLLPEERDEWQRLRAQHLGEIRDTFASLKPDQRVLLFCHDPSALPFLGREKVVQRHLPHIEQTIIGHLHTRLVYRNCHWLAGMPPISFLGKSVRRMTVGLNEAKHWRPFKVRLCPSLAGIQLLKDGGYYSAQLDPEAKRPAQFTFHPLPWK